MDINLKSSAGRSFSASFDPVTVGHLIRLATEEGKQFVTRRSVEKIDNDNKYDEGIAGDNAYAAEQLRAYINDAVPFDTRPSEVVASYGLFLAEYELLKSGAGSERACMEAFWSLCELLQGS